VREPPAHCADSVQALKGFANLRLAEITPRHGHAQSGSDLFCAAGSHAEVVDAVTAEPLAAFREIVRHRVGCPTDLPCGIGVLRAKPLDERTDVMDQLNRKLESIKAHIRFLSL